MYIIEFLIGISNMFQCESFELAPTTSRLNITRKSSETSTSIEASPGTNIRFATTHKYHTYPPCTGQWYLTSTNNIDLCSLLCYLKYITLHGYIVLNLQDFHNKLYIALSAATKTKIEVIPPFLDLVRLIPFSNIILTPNDHSIHSFTFITTYHWLHYTPSSH